MQNTIIDLATRKVRQTSPRWISVADTAKLVRAALKAAFPGVKFSVRSSSYAGGASIDISWTDGPTSKQVDAIGKRFEQGATVNGERVRYAADHVMSERKLSYELLCQCAQEVAYRYGVVAPVVKLVTRTWKGQSHTSVVCDRYSPDSNGAMIEDGGGAGRSYTAGDMVYQIAYVTSAYKHL